jgi:DNA-binding NtrC family response regulator
MEVLLIADEDRENRDQVAELFLDADYEVVAADSVDVMIGDILKKNARVVLLGSVFDSIPAGELIPILKRCNRDLTIILISDEESLPLLRKFRREGIFYHALKPAEVRDRVKEGDREELLQAVRCAFNSASSRKSVAGNGQAGWARPH